MRMAVAPLRYNRIFKQKWCHSHTTDLKKIKTNKFATQVIIAIVGCIYMVQFEYNMFNLISGCKFWEYFKARFIENG